MLFWKDPIKATLHGMVVSGQVRQQSHTASQFKVKLHLPMDNR